MTEPLKFTVVVQKEVEGGYVVRCLELPGAMSQGETEEEAMANIKDAILTVLDMMKERGESVPVVQTKVLECVVA